MKGSAIFVVPTPRSEWTGGEVFGLGDPLEEALVLDRPLSAWRSGPRWKALGASREVRGPALVVGRDLWVSQSMLRAFEKAAQTQAQGAPVRLVRDAEGPGASADPLSRLPRSEDGAAILMDLWYLPAGVSVLVPEDLRAFPEALESASGADVECRTFTRPVDVDREGFAEDTAETTLSVSVADKAAAPVSHWVELLRANLLAIGTEALKKGPLGAILSLLWAAFRARSLNPFRVLAKTTRRGRGCVVHPSAVVEGCVLGDGVKIDAGAVVRGCVLGDGAKIGPMGLAEFSVVGAGAEVQKRGTVVLSVVYPGARVGGALQIGLAGRSARLKMGAYATDMNPHGVVKVKTPGGLSPVDLGYQGVCVGHRAFVASGVWIAPGRALEEERVLLRDPAQIVMK